MNQPNNAADDKRPTRIWYNLAVEETIADFNTEISDGLTSSDAADRLEHSRLAESKFRTAS